MSRDGFLTPREIVERLDRYIIGQEEAKKIVAIAIRNRWRRQQVKGPLRDEITPSNIIMIGPTGVGKTEIARRLAQLINAPFVKVEATKFTEVGYVGKDVESMVRDLVEVSINMVKAEKIKEIEVKAEELAYNKLFDMIFPGLRSEDEREHYLRLLKEGYFDERLVEIDVEKRIPPIMEIVSSQGAEEVNFQIPEELEALFPPIKKKKKVTVKEAKKILKDQEAKKLIDMDKVIEEGKKRAEEQGIIFIDEIDKLICKGEAHGPDVSRTGVQRDLLPIVEGTTVSTKYGPVKTDHILFIAAGAFSGVSPSDLIPELQGRFPIRVELNSLTKEDFVRILTEPENALVKQYRALVKAEGVELNFTDEAIEKIAEYAYLANERMENIGARRLHTVMNYLLEELLFELPKEGMLEFTITGEYVDNRLRELVKDVDLSKYIL